MTFAEYQAAEGVNSHFLMDILRSPAHAKYNKNHHESTPELEFGNAFHCYLLEPDEFKKRYYLLPEGLDRRTKEGKAAYADAGATGLSLIKSDDFARIELMASSVSNNATAKDLLSRTTHREHSIFWGDKPKCKARLDGLLPQGVLDVKTTNDASADAFLSSAIKYKYHIQAAWYLDAFLSLGKNAGGFWTIAVEKEAPYGCAVYKYDKSIIMAGVYEVQRALKIYNKCVAEDSWPSYPHDSIELTCPHWLRMATFMREDAQ